MIYVYLIISAALIPILNNFYEILKQPNSWWLVPVLFVGFFLGFVILHMIWFFASFIFTSFKSNPDKGAKYFRFAVKITLPLVIKFLRVKVNVSGKDIDEVPTDRKMLFVCNHQHDFDPAVIWEVFPDNEIGFIGKKEIYDKMPIIGKIMHRLYGLPIDRENNRDAVKTIIGAIKLLNDGKASVGVFPEGYTSKQCELLPFRNGVFKIALKAKVPIVVCVLHGTRKLPKRLFWRGGEVNFSLVDVIYPEEYEGMSTNELGDKIHAQMSEALEKIKNR